MIRTIWAVARHDLRIWMRSPGVIAAALLPSLGLGALVLVLTVTIGVQPVALVQEGRGPMADHMAHLLEADGEAYMLARMDRDRAAEALWQLRVAAVLIVPPDFDDRIARADARVELILNNVVDVDLADDIRRAVSRSLAELDAPQLGVLGERQGVGRGVVLPSPFRVAIAEQDLRETDTGFLAYQMVPILVLIVISVGLLGTGMLVARDFERGTAKLLVLSPASRVAMVLGKLLGGVLVTLALVGPMVAAAVATHVLVPPPGHWPALLLLLMLLVVMAVGLGLLLGLVVRQTRLAAMVGLNGAAYLFFLGGGFSTVQLSPTWIQTASRLVPTSYAIRGLRQALFYPDLIGFTRDAAVLAGCAGAAAAFGVVALLRAWRTA